MRNTERARDRLEYVGKALAGYLELEKNPPPMMRFAATEIEKALNDLMNEAPEETRQEVI